MKAIFYSGIALPIIFFLALVNPTFFNALHHVFVNDSIQPPLQSQVTGLPNVEAITPRIAIAGLAIESSTFSPAQTNEEAFHAKYGQEVFTS